MTGQAQTRSRRGPPPYRPPPKLRAVPISLTRGAGRVGSVRSLAERGSLTACRGGRWCPLADLPVSKVSRLLPSSGSGVHTSTPQMGGTLTLARAWCSGPRTSPTTTQRRQKPAPEPSNPLAWRADRGKEQSAPPPPTPPSNVRATLPYSPNRRDSHCCHSTKTLTARTPT